LKKDSFAKQLLKFFAPKNEQQNQKKNIFEHCDITLKIGKRVGKKLARIDSNFANSKWGINFCSLISAKSKIRS